MFADKVVTQSMKKTKLVHVLLIYLLLLHRHKWLKYKKKQKNPSHLTVEKCMMSVVHKGIVE